MDPVDQKGHGGRVRGPLDPVTEVEDVARSGPRLGKHTIDLPS